MIKSFTNEQANLIFNNAMKALGLLEKMKTRPDVIKNVLEEFKLDDFKTNNKELGAILKKILSEPQELSYMFENIKKGLILKHPAIIEFADLALKKNWFVQSKHIEYSVHVMFVLEILTASMCNSHASFIEIQNHYKKKERERGLNTLHLFKTFIQSLKTSRSYFLTAKAFSLDALMVYFRIQRGLNKSQITKYDLKKLYNNHELSYLEYKLLTPAKSRNIEHVNELIRINIYEAGITEYKNNLKTNAICAHVLSEDIKNNPPLTIFKNKNVLPENNTDSLYKKIIEKENRFPTISYSQEWVSLYVSWNMAYVLNELDNLDIIFPKLLIPSIINSENENFMGARFISLWLSLNHGFYRMYDKKEAVKTKNKREMSKAWAKINKKYALDLAKREIHEDSKTLIKSYKRFFSKPIYNLIKIVNILLLKN